MNYVCNTVLGTEHIMNKIDKNPYSSKHLYSYLTRTYILVRKRTVEILIEEKEGYLYVMLTVISTMEEN